MILTRRILTCLLEVQDSSRSLEVLWQLHFQYQIWGDRDVAGELVVSLMQLSSCLGGRPEEQMI